MLATVPCHYYIIVRPWEPKQQTNICCQLETMLVAFEFQHVYPIYHPVRTTSLQSISCLSFECRKVLLHFLGYFSISNHSLIATGIFENVEDFSFDSFRIKFQNNWTEWICLQRNCPRYKHNCPDAAARSESDWKLRRAERTWFNHCWNSFQT